jgi:RNA-directed DNA polymerase
MYEESYQEMITVESLLVAWQEFLRGKQERRDVAVFQARLMDNLLSVYAELQSQTYRHGGYQAFNISDPKPRNIHKATVRDRLVHHLIYRQLYAFFDRLFIFDSYSCRVDKGVHRALYRFNAFSRKVSRNNTRTCWVLKCDVRKFFASIDHAILKDALRRRISDVQLHCLLDTVIDSFHTEGQPGRGLPLGNLTSQLFVNIYMDELDQFMKRSLKAKYYLRYADDFVIMSPEREWLESILLEIERFLHEKLRLQLHPGKVFIKTVASGVDFLGWVHFPTHRVLRTTTKRRMLANLRKKPKPESVTSYMGLLKHGNTWKLQSDILSPVEAQGTG